VLAPGEKKSDDSKEELERFLPFFKYHMNILLGDSKAKVGRECIFKPTKKNEKLHQDNNDNSVRILNFSTSKNVLEKSTMFAHRNIHKYTRTSLNEETQNQIDHILRDRRWHSNVLGVRIFMKVDRGTDHYLVIAKLRKD